MNFKTNLFLFSKFLNNCDVLRLLSQFYNTKELGNQNTSQSFKMAAPEKFAIQIFIFIFSDTNTLF